MRFDLHLRTRKAVGSGLALLTLATITPTPAVAGASTVNGPLAVGDLFPARRGFLQPGPEKVEPLEPGKWRLELLLSAANTLVGTRRIERALEARSGREPVTLDFLRQFDDGGAALLVDGQDHAVRVKLAGGFANGWQIGLELPFLQSADGNLDGVAETFHTFLGLDQDGRAGLVKDDNLLFISNGDGVEVFVEEAAGSGLGDLTLSAKRTLSSHGPWRRAFDATVKLPTGDRKRLMSSGSTDIALRVLSSRSLRRWHLHGGVGIIYLGHWQTLGTPPQITLGGFAAIERTHANGASTVLQLVGLESPFQEIGVPELDNDSFQLTLGGHVPLAKGRWLTLAVTENVLHFEAGSDFAFHVGVSTALAR